MEAVVILVAVAAIVGIAISLLRREFERVTIFEFQRGLRYDKGRFGGVVGPGQYRLLRRRSTITKVDSRPRVVTVPGQEVITADGVSIRVSLSTEYEIADPAVAVNDHEDYAGAFYAALQHALRDVVAGTEIDALLESRGTVGERIAEMTRGEAERLGLRLIRVDVKDFMFPGELRKTFAQVVAARKEGLAALERARGETAALRNLANAARVMHGNPELMQLRMLQELGRSGGNTIVVGLPGSTTPLPLRESAERGSDEPIELPPRDE